MRHLVAIILTIFRDNQVTKFRVFIGWSRIFISTLNFYEALRFVPILGWTPLTETQWQSTNEQTDVSLSVRPFMSQTEFDTIYPQCVVHHRYTQALTRRAFARRRLFCSDFLIYARMQIMQIRSHRFVRHGCASAFSVSVSFVCL